VSDADYFANVPDLFEAYHIADRFLDGQSVGEIAISAGVPAEKVEGRLRDMLKHLKRIALCVVCEKQAAAEIPQGVVDAYARAHGYTPGTGLDYLLTCVASDGVVPRSVALADMLGLARGNVF
jgi:hypothetical protein